MSWNAKSRHLSRGFFVTIDNCEWASYIIGEILMQGIDYFAIAPGSRNTPLVLAAAQNKKAKTMVHLDERGTGFHALGYANGTRKPACVIVTSGTAVANLMPSVMEAHYSHTPMLILTADRPPELRECGANQTAQQLKIFQDFVRWQVDLPTPGDGISIDFLRSTIAYSAFMTKNNPPGPVQVNCMFREPLYAPGKSFKDADFTKPKTQYFFPQLQMSSTPTLSLPKKGVILIGRMTIKENIPAIYDLARHLGWPVFTDILSDSRLHPPHENVITSFDGLLKANKAPHPEGVLHFGDRFISKRIPEWLANAKLPLYASILEHPYRHDPTHILTHRFFCNAESFCSHQIKSNPQAKDSSWLNLWQMKEQKALSALDDYFPHEWELTEAKFARFLAEFLPANWAIFFGNSMPIRDADLYFHPKNKLSGIFSNRGTSGIDGNIATAIGISAGIRRPLALCIGDQAFLHDVNSLAQLQKAEYPILLFIINNGGGGVFSHLPISKQNVHFDAYFRAKHPYSFAGIAEEFKVAYQKIADLDGLNKLKAPKEHALIEVITEDAKNVACYEKILKILQHALEEDLCQV